MTTHSTVRRTTGVLALVALAFDVALTLYLALPAKSVVNGIAFIALGIFFAVVISTALLVVLLMTLED